MKSAINKSMITNGSYLAYKNRFTEPIQIIVPSKIIRCLLKGDIIFFLTLSYIYILYLFHGGANATHQISYRYRPIGY